MLKADALRTENDAALGARPGTEGGDAAPAGSVAVRLERVTFAYPGSSEPVLNDLSLTLERGSFTAVIGGNGCGKSTLCKLFNGLIPQFYTGDFSGEVRLLGEPAAGRSVAELSRSVGYVYQDFENQLVRPTVLDEACFAPLNYGLPDYRERGLRALDVCGLAELQRRYVWELSGGQKHLLALAGALAMEPSVLVMDEPVSQLDPRHARGIYDCLRRLNGEFGMTIVVVEHHAEFIADYCGGAVLMDKGSVLWHLPVHAALNRVEDLRRLGIRPPEATMAALALRQRVKAPSSELLPVTVSGAAREIASLVPDRRREAEAQSEESLPSPQPMSPASREEQGAPAPPPIAELDGVRLGYRSVGRQEREVLKGIRLVIGEGERVALVGNNGAGKSSILKLMAGIAKPSEGVVRVRGLETRFLPPERLAGEAVYVFQNPEDMFIEDTVRKEVDYYFRARGIRGEEADIDRILRHFRLDGLQDRDSRLLSGGQQRRVSLAIGAAIKPALMLLDEPTANLDLATREELLGILRQLDGHVRSVVIATHDMHLASRWATRIIVLQDGQIAADGPPGHIFSDAGLLRRAGLSLTQTMELSAELGLRPLCLTPEELVRRLAGPADGAADAPIDGSIAAEEGTNDAACAQLDR